MNEILWIRGKKEGRKKGKKPSLDHGKLGPAGTVGVMQSVGGECPGATMKCPVYSPLKHGPLKEDFVLLASYLILRTKGMEVDDSLVKTGRRPDALGPRAASENPP